MHEIWGLILYTTWDNFKSYFYQVFLNAGFSELYLTYKNI